MFFRLLNMSDMIPDSISTADLMALSESAQSEAEKNVGPYGGMTAEQLDEYVMEQCQRMAEAAPTAMLPKLVIMHFVDSLQGWHARRGMQISTGGTEDDRCATAMCWHRDAGKLQAVMNILQTIDCGEGEEDFTCK